MKLTSIGTVIAKRVLTRSGKRKVIVEIGKPRRFRGGAPDYYCPFRIRGLGKDFISAGAGVDAVQALELAFVAIGSRLYFSPQGKAGELTWDAGEVPGDLGFPLMEIAEDESMIPERVMHLYLRRLFPLKPKSKSKANRSGNGRTRKPDGPAHRRETKVEKELAWRVITVAFRSTNPLQELLHLLKEHCAEAEYEEYGKAIARAIDGVQRELIDRVVAAHPEMAAQMEARIAKYGRIF